MGTYLTLVTYTRLTIQLPPATPHLQHCPAATREARTTPSILPLISNRYDNQRYLSPFPHHSLPPCLPILQCLLFLDFYAPLALPAACPFSPLPIRPPSPPPLHHPSSSPQPVHHPPKRQISSPARVASITLLCFHHVQTVTSCGSAPTLVGGRLRLVFGVRLGLGLGLAGAVW